MPCWATISRVWCSCESAVPSSSKPLAGSLASVGHPEHYRPALRHRLDHEAVHQRRRAPAGRAGRARPRDVRSTTTSTWPDTTIGPDVTLLHLLTHTSGNRRRCGRRGGRRLRGSLGRQAQLLRHRDRRLPAAVRHTSLRSPRPGCMPLLQRRIHPRRAGGRACQRHALPRLRTRARLRARRDGTTAGSSTGATPSRGCAEGWDRDADGRWVENIFSYPPIGSPDGGAHVNRGRPAPFRRRGP